MHTASIYLEGSLHVVQSVKTPGYSMSDSARQIRSDLVTRKHLAKGGNGKGDLVRSSVRQPTLPFPLLCVKECEREG